MRTTRPLLCSLAGPRSRARALYGLVAHTVRRRAQRPSGRASALLARLFAFVIALAVEVTITITITMALLQPVHVHAYA